MTKRALTQIEIETVSAYFLTPQGTYGYAQLFPAIASGTLDSNTLKGDNSSNIINGLDGNDWLYGNEGDDFLHGGNGDDVLNGGLGADYFDGGLGVDTADYSDLDTSISVFLNLGYGAGGAEGDVYFIGEDGISTIESVIGGNAFDVIAGSTAGNQLYGGKGADQLLGYSGDDILIGNKGYDLLEGGEGNDYLDGSEGVNTVSWQDVRGVGSNVTVYISDLSSGFALVNRHGTTGERDEFFNVQSFLAAGNIDDAINFGNLAPDLSVYATLIDNNFSVFNGSEYLFNATFSKFNNLYGGSGNDYFQGNSDANSLSGGIGTDALYGDNGDDILGGGKGDDLLQGGKGNDTLIGGLGSNTGDWSDIAGSQLGNSVTLQFADLLGSGSAKIMRSGNVSEEIDTFSQIQNYTGSGGADDTLDWSGAARGEMRVTVDLANNYYAAVNGGDTDPLSSGTIQYFNNLIGGVGNDTFLGNLKNNLLIGGQGGDILSGREGDDTLQGDIGNDILDGGAGDHDMATWKELNSYSSVRVDLSFDWLGYVEARVTRTFVEKDGIKTINEVDRIYNINGIEGGAGADILGGDKNTNTLIGNDGDDFIYGYHAGDHDTLLGGKGNDFIDADFSDYVDGGEGTDILLVHDAGNIRINASEGKIYDWETNELLMTAYNIETWWAGFGTNIAEITYNY